MKYIESAKNPKVKQWKKLLAKKERDKTGTYIIEGFHLVEEALKEKDLVQEVIISRDAVLPASLDISGVEVTYAANEVLKAISDTETPQGIAAVCEQKQIAKEELDIRRAVLLDHIQDPGNLGTIIRTADAAGMDAIFLGEGCADPYNPKVIRATQGSLFHIALIKEKLDYVVADLKEKGIPVYGTALENGVHYEEAEKGESFALLVGNEGQGVSKELLSQTTQNLYIPIYGRSESLNVGIAAGILMYSLRKQ
ncbi:TrmH family RNA methyltransferase [Peribacillus sp. SCS-155]|uniref:TrmH family RNA methyltransferase n=1 Tax=Peribacillus sedimenti TaxID=3115297 RepID=UPI003905A4C8